MAAVAFACAVAVAPRTATAQQESPLPVPSPSVPATPTPPISQPSPPDGATPGWSGITLGPSLAPEPTSQATPTPLPGSTSDSPGFFDISGHVRQAIDDWFRNLVESALDPVLTFLGQTVLATPNIAGQQRVGELWGVTVGIANALFVLFILAGGAIVMTHETLQTRYSLKDVLPRLVVGAITANVSLSLLGVGITFANALAQAFLGRGVDPANATAAIRDLVVAPIASGGIFVIILGLVVAVVAILLVCVYVIRVSLLIMLAVAAPLALACHALPQTQGLAALWWRAVLACLAIQVGQSLVLVTALRVFFDSDHHALGFSLTGSLVDVVVCLCLLWILLRIPGYAMRFVFAGTGHRGSTVGRMVKYGIAYKLLKRAVPVL